MRRIFAMIAIGWLVVSGVSAQEAPPFWEAEWPNTDFSTTSLGGYGGIMSGGPPKDGIPAIDAPEFHTVLDETALAPDEPVITVKIVGQKARAYPVRYLIWHEIVNDQIGDIPVSVTYCPLCNSGLAFDGRVDGRALTFGVTGKLRNSDMIMYDRQTESWWQQATGEAIVGALTGSELHVLPSWTESWASFAAENPNGLVMSEPRNHRRAYGQNPYVGYDRAVRPFLFSGEMPPHGIAPLERVVRVDERAWPMRRLRSEGEINEAGLRLRWVPGQTSALDDRVISKGRDVGSVRVWNETGEDVAHDLLFAFAFHAFWPDGTWMLD